MFTNRKPDRLRVRDAVLIALGVGGIAALMSWWLQEGFEEPRGSGER